MNAKTILQNRLFQANSEERKPDKDERFQDLCGMACKSLFIYMFITIITLTFYPSLIKYRQSEIEGAV